MGRKFVGIDAGSFGTPSYVAWLTESGVELDLVQFSREDERPLAPFLDDPEVEAVAIDAPQGLPRAGKKRRACDEQATTPTSRLPVTLDELAAGAYDDGGQRIAYRELIWLGVHLFYRHRDALHGLCAHPRLVETYPRTVYRRLTGDRPPSKKKRAFAYVQVVSALLDGLRVHCPGVKRPTVDQADAMLCAVAARAFALCEADARLGDAPQIDEQHGVIREGYIVAPKRRDPG